jgi:TctA family transporter
MPHASSAPDVAHKVYCQCHFFGTNSISSSRIHLTRRQASATTADNDAMIAAMAKAIQNIAASQTAAANAAAVAAIAAMHVGPEVSEVPDVRAARPFPLWPGLASLAYWDSPTTKSISKDS